MATTSDRHLEFIESIAKEDAAGLLKYGDSWKKRGGIGAYMTMIRKIDRMENAVKKYRYDVIKAVEADEGLIDDIRDARRYLMLIESWLREMDLVKAGDHRDKCMAHIPDAACDCSRCKEMAKIATPHIDGCQCGNCAAVRKEAARAQLREVDGIDKREAKARGCGLQCGCNDCLADYYLEQKP